MYSVTFTLYVLAVEDCVTPIYSVVFVAEMLYQVSEPEETCKSTSSG